MTIPTLPVLHTFGNYPTGWLYSDWRPQPTVVLGIFALIAAYLWFTGPKNRRADGSAIEPVTDKQRLAFVAGSLIALVSLNPPIDDLSGYLLTAHMGQHLLLTFAAVPLWLVGTPGWLLGKVARPRPIHWAGYVLTRPVAAFGIGNALTIGWHLPQMYDLAYRQQSVHVVQHASFVAGAILAWWPVFGRYAPWPRLSPPLRCVFLFANTLPASVLGSFITLGKPGLYPSYKLAPRIWGLGLDVDQQFAGLLMWVGTNVVYLVVISVIFFGWASDEEAKERRPPARADGPAGPRLDAPPSGTVG